MKTLVTLVVAVFTVGAFAAEDLNMMKQQATSNIDKKMNSLKTAKSCVSNASTMDAFKACKLDMKQDMDMQKMEDMDQMKSQKASEE
jgi:hypothetical protein